MCRTKFKLILHLPFVSEARTPILSCYPSIPSESRCLSLGCPCACGAGHLGRSRSSVGCEDVLFIPGHLQLVSHHGVPSWR